MELIRSSAQIVSQILHCVFDHIIEKVIEKVKKVLYLLTPSSSPSPRGRESERRVGRPAASSKTTPLIGGASAGPSGAIAGLVSSLVERFEFGPVDDNVLVPASALLVLLALRPLGL